MRPVEAAATDPTLDRLIFKFDCRLYGYDAKFFPEEFIKQCIALKLDAHAANYLYTNSIPISDTDTLKLHYPEIFL